LGRVHKAYLRDQPPGFERWTLHLAANFIIRGCTGFGPLPHLNYLQKTIDFPSNLPAVASLWRGAVGVLDEGNNAPAYAQGYGGVFDI